MSMIHDMNVGTYLRSYCSIEFYVTSILNASETCRIIYALDKSRVVGNDDYNDWLETSLMGGEL